MKAIKLVSGIPTMTEITTSITQYDQSILVNTEIGVSGTGYNSAHTIFTLPNSETYNGTIDELKVEVNGVGQIEGVDYNYDNNASATTFTFIIAIPKNARIRMFKIT
jgi:hypothetical protein